MDEKKSSSQPEASNQPTDDSDNDPLLPRTPKGYQEESRPSRMETMYGAPRYSTEEENTQPFQPIPHAPMYGMPPPENWKERNVHPFPKPFPSDKPMVMPAYGGPRIVGLENKNRSVIKYVVIGCLAGSLVIGAIVVIALLMIFLRW